MDKQFSCYRHAGKTKPLDSDDTPLRIPTHENSCSCLDFLLEPNDTSDWPMVAIDLMLAMALLP